MCNTNEFRLKLVYKQKFTRTTLEQFFVILMIGLLSGCTNDSSASDDGKPLIIRTVDENNQAMKAEIAKWWFSSNPETKFVLTCDKEVCSEWTLGVTITESVTVYAHAAQVKVDDEECWDFFEGEVEAQPQQKEIILTLSYKATACK